MPGTETQSGQLLAVELVDALGDLALGFLGAVFDCEVESRVWFGLGVDLYLAGVIGSVDGRLELLAVEGPLGVETIAVGGPTSLKGLELFGLRLVVATAWAVTPASKPRAARAATVRSVERPANARIPILFVKGILVIPRKLQNCFAQTAVSVRWGRPIIARKFGLNHFGLISARPESDSTKADQKFHEFDIEFASSLEVASSCVRTQVAPAGGRRFLGVRSKSRKKPMVKKPNIAIGPGLKSRK